MSTTDDLAIYNLCKAKASRKFPKGIQTADAMLQDKKDTYLTFPVCINENCHKAEWHYDSVCREEALQKFDGRDKWYLFDNLYIGISLITGVSWVKGRKMEVKLRWETYIAAFDGKVEINLGNYDLSDELDMVKLTNDIAAAAATIRDFETLILNMNSEQRKITMNFLSNLFGYCL
jgi:hypothetical protein